MTEQPISVGPGIPEHLPPGIYPDLTPDEYHARHELSSTGARYLLDNCPAKFRWWQTNGGERKKAWDEGTAAHSLVLGKGPRTRPRRRDR